MPVGVVRTDRPVGSAPQGGEHAPSSWAEARAFRRAGGDGVLGNRFERTPQSGQALAEGDARQAEHGANFRAAEPRLDQQRHGAKGRRQSAQELGGPGPVARLRMLATELPEQVTPATARLTPCLKGGLTTDNAMKPAAPARRLPILEATRHRFGQRHLHEIARVFRRLGPASRRSKELRVGR